MQSRVIYNPVPYFWENRNKSQRMHTTHQRLKNSEIFQSRFCILCAHFFSLADKTGQRKGVVKRFFLQNKKGLSTINIALASTEYLPKTKRPAVWRAFLCLNNTTRPGTRTLNQLIKRQISFILLSAFCENRLQNGCIFYLRLKQTNVNATKANIIPIYSGSGI